MNRPLIALAVGSILSSAAHAAPERLSSVALDRVVAGTETSNSETGVSANPTVIVADDSSASFDYRRIVELHDSVQEGLRALNVVNGSSADVINGMNIATVWPNVESSSVAIQQHSQFLQQTAPASTVATIERRSIDRHSSFENTANFSRAASTSSTNEWILQSRSHHSVVDTFNANVPGYFPLQNLTLTIGTPSLPSVTVPSFGFDLTTTDDVGGVYGIRGSLGPFHFDPPQLVLGTVTLSGRDLVLKGGYVQLPSLDLGSATITLCVVECGGVSVDLPTINGPRIDFGAEYRIAGANPFKDVRVNAGGGVALAGSGHLRVNLGHVRVSADMSLDLPDLTTSFSFDVLGHTVDTGKFGVEIPPISASIDLIDADIGVAYSADFSGALCLSIVTTRCDALEHHELNQDTRVEVTRSSTSTSESATTASSRVGQSVQFAGADMNGAEANVIAMSAGNAELDTTSRVELDAQAQRNLKALSAVNATGTLIGNAFNSAQASQAPSWGFVSQSNTFSQFQTRPRGR